MIFNLQVLFGTFFPCLLILFSISLLQASIDTFIFSPLLLSAISPIGEVQTVRYAKPPSLPEAGQFDRLVEGEA